MPDIFSLPLCYVIGVCVGALGLLVYGMLRKDEKFNFKYLLDSAPAAIGSTFIGAGLEFPESWTCWKLALCGVAFGLGGKALLRFILGHVEQKYEQDTGNIIKGDP